MDDEGRFLANFPAGEKEADDPSLDLRKPLLVAGLGLITIPFNGPVATYAGSVSAGVFSNYLINCFSQVNKTGDLVKVLGDAFLASSRELVRQWQELGQRERISRQLIQDGNAVLVQMGEDVQIFLSQGLVDGDGDIGAEIKIILVSPVNARSGAAKALTSFLDKYMQLEDEVFRKFVYDRVFDLWLKNIRSRIFNTSSESPAWKQLQYLLHISSIQTTEKSFALLLEYVEKLSLMTYEQIQMINGLITNLLEALMKEMQEVKELLKLQMEQLDILLNPHDYVSVESWQLDSTVLNDERKIRKVVEAENFFRLGVVVMRQGDTVRARELFNRSLGVCDEICYPLGSYYNLLKLSQVTFAAGNKVIARRFGKRLRLLATNLGGEFVQDVENWMESIGNEDNES